MKRCCDDRDSERAVSSADGQALPSRFMAEQNMNQSCKQSSRLSPQQPPAQDEDPNGGATSKKHRVTIGIGGIAAKVILVFHLLTAFAAIAAEAAASASSHSQSQSPFRFRFADNYGGSGHGGGGSGGFRWKRFPEVAPTAANNADLLVRKLMKRSTFDDLDCRGMYDQEILNQLGRICEDCYNLYKDAEVHGYCRMDCFSSETFRHCLQSLLLDQESDFYTELVQIVGKRRRRRR